MRIKRKDLKRLIETFYASDRNLSKRGAIDLETDPYSYVSGHPEDFISDLGQNEDEDFRKQGAALASSLDDEWDEYEELETGLRDEVGESIPHSFPGDIERDELDSQVYEFIDGRFGERIDEIISKYDFKSFLEGKYTEGVPHQYKTKYDVENLSYDFEELLLDDIFDKIPFLRKISDRFGSAYYHIAGRIDEYFVDEIDAIRDSLPLI